MKTIGIAGLALALIAAPQAVSARRDSGPVGAGAFHGSSTVAHSSRWASKRDGRWLGGWNAPGGWNSYRAPSRGYVLPSYWVNPSFYIGNYSSYGFSRPQPGYGWSRYYDDAVMTDADGRVYDSVHGVNWDRYADADEGSFSEDYSDSYGYRDDVNRGPAPRGRDRDSGLGGAVIGGVVGAVAGNVIGGRGNRLAGSLIGGGVGALAGAAIDLSDKAGRGYREPRVRHNRHDDDRQVVYDDNRGDRDGGYDEGSRRVYRGDNDRGYEGRRSHWGRGGRGYDRNYGGYNRGYSYGYGAPEVTVITYQSQPVVTTTTTTSEQVIYAKSAYHRVWHKPVRHYWKPRAQCVCGS